MSLTAKDLALRKTGITATDIVTLATEGDGGYGSPLEVYAAKVSEASGFLGNMRTEMGHAAEPVILRQLEKVYGLKNVVPGRTIRSGLVEYYVATPDAIVLDAPGGAPIATEEVKLVGRRMVPRWYGEDGEVLFPQECLIQITWQMLVMRTSREYAHSRVTHGYLGALLGDFGEDAFHPNVFPWAGAVEDLSFGLQDMASRFWVDNVLARVPPTPDGSERAREALERIYPAFRRPVLAPASPEAAGIMARLCDVRAIRGLADKEYKELQNKLRAAIGEAGTEGLRSGEHKCTWSETSGRLSLEKVVERSGLPAHVLDECRGTPSRVLRVSARSAKDKTYDATVRGLVCK